MGTNKQNWLSADRYKTPTRLSPRDEGTRALYYKIYSDYISYHMTHRQLADEYNYHPSHIAQVLKWVAMQMGDFDADAQLQAIIDKTLMRQQQIEMMVQDENVPHKVKASLFSELRKCDTFIAKLRGLISNSFIDASDRSKKVVVITNPNLERGNKNEEIPIDATEE